MLMAQLRSREYNPQGHSSGERPPYLTQNAAFYTTLKMIFLLLTSLPSTQFPQLVSVKKNMFTTKSAAGKSTNLILFIDESTDNYQSEDMLLGFSLL